MIKKNKQPFSQVNHIPTRQDSIEPFPIHTLKMGLKRRKLPEYLLLTNVSERYDKPSLLLFNVYQIT